MTLRGRKGMPIRAHLPTGTKTTLNPKKRTPTLEKMKRGETTLMKTTAGRAMTWKQRVKQKKHQRRRRRRQPPRPGSAQIIKRRNLG
jgi:hypothetical protein